MAAIGGSDLTLTLAGRTYQVDPESSGTFTLGGDSNTVAMNSSGKTFRIIKSTMSGKLENERIEINDLTDDFEYIQELANSNKPFPVICTRRSGAVYKGTVTITGDINYDPVTSTCEVTIEGTVFTK